MKKTIFTLCLVLAATCAWASFAFNNVGGWYETAYAEWGYASNYDYYHAYVTSDDATFTRVDSMLLRDYGHFARVDVVGLAAGTYKLRIVPVIDGAEQTADALTTDWIDVYAYDRSGFAHKDFANQMGAYDDNGVLRSDAKVLYITSETAATVTTDVVYNNKGDVRTATELQHILTAYQKGFDTTPLAIRFVGHVVADDLDSLGSSEEGLEVKGRTADSYMPITIEGIGYDACVSQFGMLIRNCKGVEIRNLGFFLFMDDGLSFDTDNTNCWAHHLDFFYGNPGSAADQVKGDGSLDCKADSKQMTFSYIHFWDSGKMSLCGMKNESVHSRICYHHNWFDHSDSRHPRVRTMTVHVWNNYFDGNAKYGVGVTTGASVFVENNYFRGAYRPMMISLQGTDIKNGANNGTFSKEKGGIIKAYGNQFVDNRSNFSYVTYAQNQTDFDAYEVAQRTDAVPETVVCKEGGSNYNNFDISDSLMYTYTPLAAADVPGVVTGALGAGRMQGGDIAYTFTTADDTNDAVMADLKSLLTSYQSGMQRILVPTAHSGLERLQMDVPSAQLDLSQPVYDVLGRRMYAVQKGQVYIQNGQKVVLQ